MVRQAENRKNNRCLVHLSNLRSYIGRGTLMMIAECSSVPELDLEIRVEFFNRGDFFFKICPSFQPSSFCQ